MTSSDYLVVPDFWEEHCIECGAPACYGTCGKFLPAPGGVCRRFARGIERKGDGFAVQFLPWGKLELYWQGRMVTPGTRARFEKGYVCVAPLVRRILGETGVRGVCRRVTAHVGVDGRVPTQWIIRCRAKADEQLIASVANSDGEEIWVKRLALLPGENVFEMNLPPVAPRSFFRLASLDGSNGRIFFTQCDVRCEAKPKFVKCVAWDLDNTLWDGVLANDGPEGVKIRAEVVETIKTLDRRGILHTICSKNDAEPVRAVLRKFDLSDYFVFPAINWNPKSENLKKLAKDINIGLDAFAFVDDSEHERGEVAENLPMVRVFREVEAAGLPDRPEFDPPVSKESSSRRLSYLAEMARRQDEEIAEGTHEDFLRKCAIELVCERLDSPEITRRCWELVNRTNQLTLAAHRYTEGEFVELLRSGEAWAIRCRDKYGDYGVVGFVAVAACGDRVEVREFVMSCRVAKKCCEQSVLLALADRFKTEGRRMLSARVVSTGRNGALIQAFDTMPFVCEEAADARMYTLDLTCAAWGDAFRNACEVRG